MAEPCWELVASDEPMIFAEPLLDTIVMEGSQNDVCFADPANPMRAAGVKLSAKVMTLSIKSSRVTPETDSRRRGR